MGNKNSLTGRNTGFPEGARFRRADGRVLEIREAFDDGAYGADVFDPAFPLVALEWVEETAEVLAMYERLPNLRPEDLLQ